MAHGAVGMGRTGQELCTHDLALYRCTKSAWGLSTGGVRTFNCGASLTNRCIFLTEMRIPSVSRKAWAKADWEITSERQHCGMIDDNGGLSVYGKPPKLPPLHRNEKRDEKAWSPLQLQEKYAVDAPTALYVDGPEALVDPVSKAARALSVFFASVQLDTTLKRTNFAKVGEVNSSPTLVRVQPRLLGSPDSPKGSRSCLDRMQIGQCMSGLPNGNASTTKATFISGRYTFVLNPLIFAELILKRGPWSYTTEHYHTNAGSSDRFLVESGMTAMHPNPHQGSGSREQLHWTRSASLAPRPS
ncbi:hypothetical protein TWF225_000590 [Orbilia oligospora]|nr:hypothetical protein TWF225_000590 [Orbilia oligospora]KAF3264660.1 hypothetical protein TWF128_001120 [Orbilia oligospora]KAF3268447.1 hypothetical protein TWF217_011036 [Orbilia oligospora]